MTDQTVTHDESLIDQGLDALETGLQTFGGAPGVITAEVLEDIRFLFDEGIEASTEKALNEIPNDLEKLSGGAISAVTAKKYMSELLKNDTVKGVINTISDVISKLIDELVNLIQKGEDLTVEKVDAFLDKLGGLAAPLKDLVKQVDQAIDKTLDSAKKAADGMTKSIDAGIDKFVDSRAKGEVKSLMQLENGAKATEQLGEVAKAKTQSVDVLQEATKIIQQSGLHLDANNNKIDSPNSSKAPEQKGVVAEEKSAGISR